MSRQERNKRTSRAASIAQIAFGLCALSALFGGVEPTWYRYGVWAPVSLIFLVAGGAFLYFRHQDARTSRVPPPPIQ